MNSNSYVNLFDSYHAPKVFEKKPKGVFFEDKENMGAKTRQETEMNQNSRQPSFD